MPLCAWGRQKRRDDEDDGHFEQGVARHASRDPPPWVVHAFSFRLNLRYCKGAQYGFTNRVTRPRVADRQLF